MKDTIKLLLLDCLLNLLHGFLFVIGGVLGGVIVLKVLGV